MPNMVKKKQGCSWKACWFVDDQNFPNFFGFLQGYPNEKATGMFFFRWSVDFPNLLNFPSSGSDRGVFFSRWFVVKAFWQCFWEMGIPVFSVDLLIFQICKTFQAQDRIGASFFLVDFVSKHFESISERWVYPFFPLICWFSKFSKLSKLRIGQGRLFFALICCQSILSVFLRDVYCTSPFIYDHFIYNWFWHLFGIFLTSRYQYQYIVRYPTVCLEGIENFLVGYFVTTT